MGDLSSFWGAEEIHPWVRSDVYSIRFQASISPEELDKVVESCNEHDRMTWIGSDAAPQKEKVRMQIRVRGSVNSTTSKFPRWMSDWRKSTYARERGDSWRMVEHEVPVHHTTPLYHPSHDLIVLLQAPYPFDRDFQHESRGRKRGTRTERRGYPAIRIRRTPPQPPRPSREASSYSNTIETTSTVEGSNTTSSADSPQKKGSASIGNVPLQESGDAAVNLSPTSEPSSDEEVHTSAVAIKLESHLPFEPTSLVATRVLFEKGEKETPQEKRVTMSKSRKKAFVCGVETMNHGDHLLQALVGLKPSPGSQRPFVLVFTSHPMLFADASVFRTIDTGHAAQFVLEDQVGPELFDEPREMGLVPLNHARLLSEATSFCEYARIPWVNLDVLDTKRWDNYALAEIPRICSSTIALTTNSEELGDLIEAWCKTPSHLSQSSQDDPERHFDELFSLEFAQQLAEIGEHFHLEAVTHAAFPAEAVQEHEEDTFDAIESQEDLGVQDPVEQLVSEETFLDTVDVPGLPLEEAKRHEG